MSQGPRYHMKPRRRRKGLTDYRKRLNLLKSNKIRLVIRKSLKHTNVQFIEYKENGDNILATATSKELESKYNWKYSTGNTSAAYLTGLLAGKRAQEKGIKECVLDIGRQIPVKGSKVFATLKGVLDAGLECPHDDEKIPSEQRILGEHIDKDLSSNVNKIKDKITGGK